ncbi:hypothetical protein ISN45_Aa01g006110 [Arabidopsis thaliana x Arabidopsis arenosa]|uniref:Uncharacterized protein n=1 Tax=Arabidopsis thaliana x Arabidopsis arenosa TaxID=1240361 RepID=A0A8T2C112_9BRAS|nr:hypothetical protein ISN45_Aa01g006110 [Arabidopsis thaliana x Arabidopsis arenosa]
MRSDHDGSPPENTKREVEDREIRIKSSREKPSGAGKDSGEEKDVSRRRESKKRTKDGNDSGSESGLDSGSESESEKEERRRSRKDRGKRKSDRKSSRRRHERRRRKRKRREREEKERKRRRREKDKKKRNKSDKDGDRKKKKKSEKVKKGAVTESWGKYGIIRETDMWNKRPEFTAWLLEVKKVNLESLPPWEEKKMFKDFMEDHNTGTFTSKKYYDIDGYYRLKLEKEMKKGLKKAGISERTVFNDEEQRRLAMQELRERQKEEEVLALKRSMEGGMAQAMKEQARLKEEMVYLYKIGDMEGAAAIQRRLDPDVPM